MPEFLSSPSHSISPASLFLLLNLVIGTIAIVSRFTANRKPPQEEQHRPPFARSPSLIDRVRSFNLSFNRHAPVDSHTAPYYQQNGFSDGADHPPAFERSPSLLDRVRSFNMSINRHAPLDSDTTSYYQQSGFSDGADHPLAIERSPSLLERLRSMNFSAVYRSEPEMPRGSEAEIAGEAESEWPEAARHRVERSKSEQVAAPERKEAEKLKRSASEKAAVEEDDEEGEGVERRRPATVRYEKTTSFGDEAVDEKADDFINKFKQQLKLQRLDSLLRYRDMLRGK